MGMRNKVKWWNACRDCRTVVGETTSKNGSEKSILTHVK